MIVNSSNGGFDVLFGMVFGLVCSVWFVWFQLSAMKSRNWSDPWPVYNIGRGEGGKWRVEGGRNSGRVDTIFGDSGVTGTIHLWNHSMFLLDVCLQATFSGRLVSTQFTLKI